MAPVFPQQKLIYRSDPDLVEKFCDDMNEHVRIIFPTEFWNPISAVCEPVPKLQCALECSNPTLGCRKMSGPNVKNIFCKPDFKLAAALLRFVGLAKFAAYGIFQPVIHALPEINFNGGFRGGD
jgi:hypothetical protein